MDSIVIIPPKLGGFRAFPITHSPVDVEEESGIIHILIEGNVYLVLGPDRGSNWFNRHRLMRHGTTTHNG